MNNQSTSPSVSSTSAITNSRFAECSGWRVFAAVAILSGVFLLWESPLAFLTAILDGLPAVMILTIASLAGLWLVWGSGNSDLPIRWQVGLGAGFGLGLLSLGTLLAGLKGYLGQRFWLAVVILLTIAGIAAVYRLCRLARSPSLIADDADPPASSRWRWLWLLIVPAIALGVLAATVPPGLLWIEEGNGYDVLEYHLGVPKEYFFLGRIAYLDHNVYSNFPMNAEMLYLLSMVLYGSPFQAAIPAQMIHLFLGVLAGYAAWLIGRDYSPKVGIVTGIAGVAFPWSIYLGGLAYVENGMLFYGLLAAGLCNRAIRLAGERTCFRALAVGAMVGLACGYKYTAIPMIAVPLLTLWAILNLSSRPARFSNALTALLIAVALFAPWMCKNQRMTGDPFFPLGYRAVGSKVWTDADYAKFQKGHAPLASEQPLPARLDAFWHRVLADPRWGYVPWVCAAAGLGFAFSRRSAHRGEARIWLAVLVVQILVWLLATHLFARFASVLWIPLVFLISMAAAQATQTRPGKPLAGGGSSCAALAIVGLLVYLAVGYRGLFHEYRRHLYPAGQQIPIHGNTEALFHGYVAGFDHLGFINGTGQDNPGLPYDAKLLMVGDAKVFYVNRPCDYCVVFSQNRFAGAIEQAGGSPERVIGWLREQGYTHVWVDFAELARLGGTYGLPEQLNIDLFPLLEAAGLRRLHEARIPIGGTERPYGVLYEVPKP